MMNKPQQLLLLLIVTLTLVACKEQQLTKGTNAPEPNTTSSANQASPQPSSEQLQDCNVKPFSEKVSEKDAAFKCANIYPEKPKLVFINNETTETLVSNLKEKLIKASPSKDNKSNSEVLPFLLPPQTMETRKSRAHLQFNEGSAYRADYGTEFKLEKDSRRSTIEKGGVLVMIERTDVGNFNTSIKTSETDIESKRTVYVVRRNAEQKRTEVFVLSEGPVRVSAKGKAVELRAGESVAATQAGLEEKRLFGICRFYVTEDLVKGLGPWKEDLEFVDKLASPLQRIYHAVRSETVAAYWQSCPQRQEAQVVYLCPPAGSP